MRKARIFASQGLEIFVLTGFALAQPVFDVLARSPEFLAVRRAGPSSIVAVVIGIVAAIPGGLSPNLPSRQGCFQRFHAAKTKKVSRLPARGRPDPVEREVYALVERRRNEIVGGLRWWNVPHGLDAQYGAELGEYP